MNEEMQSRAVQAAQRFVERRGYTVLDTGWSPEEGAGAIDIVAQDDETIVFIDVTAAGTDGFENGHTERGTLEVLAARYLGEHAPEGDVGVRFDTIDMMVVSADRALLRHHISAFSEA